MTDLKTDRQTDSLSGIILEQRLSNLRKFKKVAVGEVVREKIIPNYNSKQSVKVFMKETPLFFSVREFL